MIFRRVVSRAPTKTETSVLVRELNHATEHYAKDTRDANELLDFGQPETRFVGEPPASDPQELAAYMVVASMVFNLDEAMTHE